MEISDLGGLLNEIKSLDEKGHKVMKNTVSDMKKKIPTIVKKSVTEVYNIKPGEITQSQGKNANGKKAANIYTTGQTIENVAVVYTGRTLTPLHFSMTPTKMPAKRKKKPQNIKLTILKGNQRVLHGKYNTPPFLAPAARSSSTIIPFQRITSARTPVTAIHSLSVPQMIDNEKVNTDIHEKINKMAMERLNHNTNRFMK